MPKNGNAALYFIDRHLAEGRGDKIAFREADGGRRSLSYAELAARTGCFAGALMRHGVRREERIALIMRDELEFPIAFWGALKAGAIPVPLNTLLSTQVYEAILNDSRASLLIVSEALWETIAPILRDNRFLRAVLIVGAARENAIRFDDFMAGAKQMAPVDAHDDELAFWLYSSGSTGLPKGVRHVHSSLKATSDTFGRQVLGIKESDVVYSVAKMFFAYGLGNAMTFPMAVGATTILFASRPTPQAVFDILTSEHPSIFYAVPTFFAAMSAAHEQAGAGKASTSLRIATSAGEALPREIGERWQNIWGVEIIDGVGSTEMLHIFLSNRPGDVEYGTSGLPVPGYEVRLVDEHDEDVERGHIGELLVRGPSAAEGYWNRRESSQRTFAGHWTRTGDKYEQNQVGRFIYRGRADDMFKVSGIWVSPFEVEQALVEHPAILEAAVIAKADDQGLDKPKAFIVVKEGHQRPEVDEVREFVKARIGMWKYPRWIEFVPDLPKTATGKIQRFKLRDAS